MLKKFTYHFDAGPLGTKEELFGDWQSGNCRRAVQLYFYKQRKIFLGPEQILCPEAYYRTGKFVIRKNEEFNFNVLQEGDIVYAEKIRDSENNCIDKHKELNNDYLIALHTAIYTGEKGKEIWHATAVESESCYWSIEKFSRFYRPVAAKRILENQ